LMTIQKLGGQPKPQTYVEISKQLETRSASQVSSKTYKYK